MRAVISSTAGRTVLALLAVVVSTAGCATKGDLRNVRNEIRGLAARQDSLLAEMRLQRALTSDTLGRQTRQLTDLRGDVSQQLRAMAATLDALTEMAGQNSRDISAIRDQMVTARRPTVSDPMAGPGMSSGGMSGADADSLYDIGYDLYMRNSWNAAQRAFAQFLEQYPRDELAPKAHANLADILYQQGRIDEAIEKFLVIPEEFPTDPEVPSALYRVALLEIERGDEDEARRHLRLIINTYPDDPMAELARERLDELGG